MRKDSQISIQINPALKRKVVVYLVKHGLSMTEVIVAHLKHLLQIKGVRG